MAMHSRKACLLALSVLLVGAAGVNGHASSKLRGILGQDAPGSGQMKAIGLDLSKGSDGDVKGDLACPARETLKIGTLDAAQNPSCVKCGGHLQFACNEFPSTDHAASCSEDGSRCKKGLKVLDTASCVQPLCIPDEKFEPRKVKRTAKGRNINKGGAATFSVTKELACGMHGLPCCASSSCDMGLACRSNTCTLAR